MPTPALRAFLVSVTVLGGIITGVSTTGVLAPTTDSALTGTAEKELVQTGVFASNTVDLQLGADGCAAFSDNLVSPLVMATGITTTTFNWTNIACIQNVGTVGSRLEFRVLPGSLSFTDDACSPNEDSVEILGCSDDLLSKNVDFELTTTNPKCPAFDQTSGGSSVGGARVRATTDKLEPGATCPYNLAVHNISPLTLADQTDSLRWQFEFRTL